MTDVVGSVILRPDASLVRSLGSNHSLESGLADLLDNSIDANATRVLIRLLTDADRLVQVQVLDNGDGMDDEQVEAALTLGRRRSYSEVDLGHFGMGLKSASFGYCDTLTVWTARTGCPPAGRRIGLHRFAENFTCDVLTEAAAADDRDRRVLAFGTTHGTTIVWDDLRNTYLGRSATEARLWLANATAAIRAHIGLHFHRLIAGGRVQVEVQVDDIAQFDLGIGVPVSPIDPFGYATSGFPGYPKPFLAAAGDRSVPLVSHIWPAKSDRTGWRVGTTSGEDLQGFFVYRHDRLLQAGGWADIANRTPQRQLARVVLDDSDAIGPLITMNPEKRGVRFEPTFQDALTRAVAADGSTFHDYLLDAESAHTTANRRKFTRRPATTPDKGFAPAVRRAIAAELPLLTDESVRIQWRAFGSDEFLEVDFPQRVIWLNSRYRALFTPGRGSLNDAPVLKALLYLLSHQVFEGQYLGSRDKDEIEIWRSVLNAAALTEQRQRRPDADA